MSNAMTAQQAIERTAESWWAWHDADCDRHSVDMSEAEARCAAWVAGDSDDGPTVIDPDAQCAEHGCARWRCAAEH